MTAWKLPDNLQPILERLVWFEPARSEASIDPDRFLQMAMAYASEGEIEQIRLKGCLTNLFVLHAEVVATCGRFTSKQV